MSPPVGARSSGHSSASRRAIVVAGAFVVCTVLATAASPVGDGRRHWVTAGYVPYWDQADGFAEVADHFHTLSHVSPWWFTFDEEGEVVPQHEAVDVDLAAVEHLRLAGVAVVPTIANHANGSWIPAQTSALLADPDRREVHVEHIVELVTSHGFDGIDIDYEDLTADDRAGFSSFVTELGAELHDKRKILTVTVHPKPSDAGYDQRNLAQDYAAIGAAADQVRVMAYDWHATGSDPGPVAPLDWVRTIVTWTATQIPPDKIVLGIPLYAYDWGPEGDAVALTVPEAEALARDHGQSIQRDPANGSAWFDYTAADGTAHRVWLEDAFAADGKVMLAAERGLGGVFLWRLGDVEDQLWDVLPRLSSAIS